MPSHEVYRPGSYPTMLEDMQAAQRSWDAYLERRRALEARDEAVRDLVEAARPDSCQVLALGRHAVEAVPQTIAA